MKSQSALRRPGPKNRHNEKGIALVITLGVLAVILLIGVAFALSSRTEVKSAMGFDALVSSKSLARMGMDRCLMELVFNGEGVPYSGGNTTIYTSANFMRAYGGNYTNDTSPLFSSYPADFVNLDSNPTRGPSEPYWIKVTDTSGKIIGRFAYTIVSDTSTSSINADRVSLLDINATGNIYEQQQLFKRSMGYLGVTNGAYTRATCSDVDMIAYLTKLNYADPTNAAWRILSYRYGWPGGNPNPCSGCYNPGKSGDDNLDSYNDEPAEYDPVNLRGSGANFDHAISGLYQIETIPIAPDPAFGNLLQYATTYSGESNLTNADGVARLNINSSVTGRTADVATVVTYLQQAFPTNDLNQLSQWAVNIVDFHCGGKSISTNWPTIYKGGSGGTNTFIGVKPFPYLNQICPKITLSCSAGTGANTTNARIQITADTHAELWNPYPKFSEKLGINVTNVITFALNPPIPGISNVTIVCAPSFGSFVDPGYQTANDSVSWTSPWFSTNYLPRTLVLTNRISWVYVPDIYPSNILSVGSVVALPSSNITLTTTTGAGYTPNIETDDPRIPILYSQTNGASVGGAGNYGLGYSNQFTWADQGGPNGTDREGTNSFYFKGSNYVSIAEVGYVHKGLPWQTARLQPGGDGRIIDYLRVNDLAEIRGRININADTTGLGGAANQSPALWGLFGGLSNGTYGVISSNKICDLIQGMGDYRASIGGTFSNISQIVEVSNLVYNVTAGDMAATNDAERESTIVQIANLITTRSGSGTEVVAWGQAFKGNAPVGTITVHAWYTTDPVSNRIKITKYEYIRE